MKHIKFFVLGCVALMILGACGENKELTKKKESKGDWVTTWSQSLKGIGLFPVNDNGHTVEYEIPIQNEGEEIKLTLGNYYSEDELEIANVSISKQPKGNYEAILVDGQKNFTIEPRGFVQTDAQPLEIQSGESLFVRIYYTENSEDKRAVSGNGFAKKAIRSISGDYTNKDELKEDTIYVDSFKNDPFAMKYADAMEMYKLRFTLTIEGVDVKTKAPSGTIVAFGDSITEQSHWVTPLQKEVKDKLGDGYSVVNAGISGNRLLREIKDLPRKTQYFGLAGTERFEHDVYQVNANVATVIIALGINDIHQPGTEEQFPLEELPTFNEMVQGYEKMIKQAKEHDSLVYMATIGPFIGYAEDIQNNKKEELRQQINSWIYDNQKIDGVIDFNKVLSDPEDPTLLNPIYDSGDKLHPNEKGGAAMAEIINVENLVSNK